MIAKMESIKTGPILFKYHTLCRVNYSKQSKKKSQDHDQTSEWHKTRKEHEKALTKALIDEQILKNEEVLRAQDIYQKYLKWLQEFGGNEAVIQEEFYKLHHFLEKIEAFYKEKIKWTNHPNKDVGKILFKTTMPIEKAFQTTFPEETDEDTIIGRAAFIIRKAILNAERNKLPANLSVIL